MQLREYQPSDCAQMAELFYQTVHSVNAKNYTKEQLDACYSPLSGHNLSPPCEGAEVSAPSFFLPSYAGHGMTSLSGGSSFGCFSSGCMALSNVPMSR